MRDGYVYQITNDLNDKVYVGSTTQSLSKRMDNHRQASVKAETPFYVAFRENPDVFHIYLLEKVAYEDRAELLAKEGEWIRKLDSNKTGYNINNSYGLEKNSPIYHQRYYIENKDSFHAYNIKNREIKKRFNTNYYKENKEEQKERVKAYYNEKQRIKVECEVCHLVLFNKSLKKHQEVQHKIYK